MHRKRAILAFVVAIALWPMCARADAGTPLVWTSAFHLFLGNALIGIFEGWLLARAFHLPQRRCIWSLILANYLSAWIGFGLMSYLFEKFGKDIYSGLRVTWMLVAATYLLTLLLEWPFVAFCFRTVPQWFRKSVKGSLLLQSASYVLLFGAYWLVSGTSLYTGMQVIPQDQTSAPGEVVVFFISTADGDVYRSELGSATDIKIGELGSTNFYDDHLELRESKTDSNRWDIAAVFERRQDRIILPGVATKEQIPEEQAQKTSQYYGWGIAPFQVGDATNSAWHFGWAHWPDVGMWARSGSRTVRIAYGTPFGGYTPYRVIQLPEDKALLQLDQQICLVDIPAGKIARIRKGYGMLAFRKNQIVEPDGATNGSQSIRSETNRTPSAAGFRR